MIYEKTEQNFRELLMTCFEYAYTEQSASASNQYLLDVCNAVAKSRDSQSEGWLFLTNTGVFHDAIGKPVSESEESVCVSEDY